ncbi:MAG: DUF1614 domain-containing protein [Deltaproteobacteria bacterium]|nr:DUF1614 domain-containing protein [Deltaproteobacteria bacterium]
MFFPPLIFLLMFFFLLIALVLLPFLMVGMMGSAFIKLGLPPTTMFWLLILTLVGSMINIPIYQIESQNLMKDQMVSFFGMRYRAPVVRTQKTVLAINVGGAVIPALLSLYLLTKMELTLGVPLVVGLVTLVSNRLARPVRGLGIALPGLIPPVVAALGAYLFCPPELRAPTAYIAGTMGILVGADILKLNEIGKLGAPVASIGGAGTFDAIFLSGIIAVLLS